MFPRAESNREQLKDFVRGVPFQPFVIVFENGDRVPVEHPENIAFDPEPNGRSGVTGYAGVSGEAKFYSHLGAITSFVTRDPRVGFKTEAGATSSPGE